MIPFPNYGDPWGEQRVWGGNSSLFPSCLGTIWSPLQSGLSVPGSLPASISTHRECLPWGVPLSRTHP